ncbi:MAG: histidinol-phosphate transaminase [Nitrososphaerales archaeon]
MKERRIFSYFKPYQWEESSEAIAKKYGLEAHSIIRFDTNTSPFTPKKWLEELSSLIKDIKVNHYPDTTYISLKRALAEYNECEVEEIVVTNGADEALDIIAKSYIDCEDSVVISSPTYGMFRIVVELLGGRIIEVNRLEDFEDDFDSLLEKEAKLFFLCSPNNPTGNSCRYEGVLKLLEKGKRIVIDEAYYEFSLKSFKELIKDYENLIIVRTLSKAFALAGARVGYILANKKIVEHLNKVRPPNSLSVISLALAEIALKNADTMRESVKEIIEEREICYSELKNIKNIEPYKSEANFILFKILNGKAKYIHEKLMERGLVLRNFEHNNLLSNFLRFTVNLRENNKKFLNTLRYLIL